MSAKKRRQFSFYFNKFKKLKLFLKKIKQQIIVISLKNSALEKYIIKKIPDYSMKIVKRTCLTVYPKKFLIT